MVRASIGAGTRIKAWDKIWDKARDKAQLLLRVTVGVIRLGVRVSRSAPGMTLSCWVGSRSGSGLGLVDLQVVG